MSWKLGSPGYSPIIDNVFSRHGTNELLDLLENAHIFPFPKPTGLIAPLLEFGATDRDNIVAIKEGVYKSLQITAHEIAARAWLAQ